MRIISSIAKIQLALAVLAMFVQGDVIVGSNLTNTTTAAFGQQQGLPSLDKPEQQEKKKSDKKKDSGNPLFATGKAFTISKASKHGNAYLCSVLESNGESKLQFKSGWLWVKKYKDSDDCAFFYDKWSKTFINVALNDKSVLISDQRNQYELVLVETNVMAPGPHPFQLGGPQGNQFVLQRVGENNILCFKWLNIYMLRSETWISSHGNLLKDHINCEFNLGQVEIDPSKLVTKHPWKNLPDWQPKTKLDAEYGLYQSHHFYIESAQKKNMFLDISGKNKNVVLNRRSYSDSQIFFFDHWTKTIRSLTNKEYALSIENEGAKMKKLGGENNLVLDINEGHWSQNFKYDGNTTKHLQCKEGAIQAEGDAHNSNILVWGDIKQSPNQKWNIRYLENKENVIDPLVMLEKTYGMRLNKEFHIQSKMASGRYLDILNGKFLLRTSNGFSSQNFYFDQKTRTVMNSGFKGKSIEIVNQGSSNSLALGKTVGKWWQNFKYKNSKFFNDKAAKVVEVQGDKDAEDAVIQMWKNTNSVGQTWKLLYIEEMKPILKGQLDKTFGLYVKRPFYILSQLPMGRALSVVEGRNIIIRRKKDEDKDQQFYFDGVTKTIKSVSHHTRCLDIQNAGKSKNLQIFESNSRWFQLFKVEGDLIINEKGQALDVEGGLDSEGANVKVLNKSGKDNQKWEIAYIDAMKPEPIKGEMNNEFGLFVEREFYIVSQMASRRYLDFVKDSLAVRTPNGRDTQRWFFDQWSKTIKTVSDKKQSLNAAGEGKGMGMNIAKTTSGWWQIWKFYNDSFINIKNMHVLDVTGAKDSEGQKVIQYKRHNGANQRWRVVYVDEAVPDQTKGLNKEYGLFVNRPFYIISRLPMARALEVIQGRNVVIMTRAERNSQHFIFDAKTKTINSIAYKGKCLDIENDGKSSNLQIWNISSRWFQMFRLKGESLVNERGKVIEVSGGHDDDNQNAQVQKSNQGLGQKWDILYLDEVKPDPIKGQLNAKYNIVVEQEFYIVSSLPDGKYLDIIGTDVVVKTPNGKTTQKWYFDQISATIKSVGKAGMSLSIQEKGTKGFLQVSETKSQWWQLFRFVDDQFMNIRGKVIDIAGNKIVEGKKVSLYKQTGSANQKWKLVYCKDATAPKTKGYNKVFGFFVNRPFYFVSKLPMERVLDVQGGKNLLLLSRNGKDTQKWVFDEKSKTIKSFAYKNKCLDIENAGQSANMQIWNINSRWFQMFKFAGDRIVNEQGKAIDVSGGRDDENRNVEATNQHNGVGQRWSVVYADEIKPVPSKGQINESFGLYVERPFFVVSLMRSRRYLDIIGNDLVVKTANGYDTQKWWFDQKSKTIKSYGDKSKSWHIKNSGQAYNMFAWRTDSGWWQLFKYQNEQFVNAKSGKVLDVQGNQDSEGQKIIVWRKHTGLNQRWKIIYVDQAKGDEVKGLNKQFGFWINRPFYVVSRLPMRRVLTVLGGRNVVINDRANKKSQQWSFDQKTKTIKSVANTQNSLEIQGSGMSNNVQLWKTNARWFQMFKSQGDFILNEKGKALDVAYAHDENNKNVVVAKLTKKISQQWEIMYVDEMKPDPKKGDLAGEFGMYVERLFYIVSGLQSGRYLDIVKGKPVIKTPNGFDSQKWYFDYKTKSIRSDQPKHLALTIATSGGKKTRTNVLSLEKIQSAWWQVYKYQNENFVNINNDYVLDVNMGRDIEGQPVQTWKKNNSKAQKWKILYVDQAVSDQSKGLNKAFGFFVNRPFFISSLMPMRRVISVRGTNLVINPRVKTNRQHFYFDAKSKTLCSVAIKGQSISIEKEGSSRNLNLGKTNSRWFQLFKVKGNALINEKGKAIDVSGGRDIDNRNVQVWKVNKTPAQQWEILYIDEVKPEPKKGELSVEYGLYTYRDFYLVSGLASRRQMDVLAKNVVIKTPNGFDSQRWFFDWKTRSIRNVKTKKVLSIEMDGRKRQRTSRLMMSNARSQWWQMFRFQDEKLVNMKTGYAIDSGKLDAEGARVTAQTKRSTPQQKWTVLYVDQSKPMQKLGMNQDFGFFINRPFNIVSNLPMRRLLQATKPGQQLIIKRRVLNDKGQSFYFDGSTKTIVSTQYKGLAITIANEGKSTKLTLSKNGSRWFQMFKIKDEAITGEKGQVFGTNGGKDLEKRGVQAQKLNKSVGQKWSIQYIDEIKPDPKSGELASDWGLYVGRPFFIISQLPSRRYLDIVKGSPVIKIANGLETQKWQFDYKSQSIQSIGVKKSLTIRGRNTKMEEIKNQWFQMFKLDGEFVYNIQNKEVLDVGGGKDVEGQRCLFYKRHGGKNQRWRIVYVDEAPKPSTSGINKEFGFFIDRPFYIMSKLPMRRVLDIKGGRNVNLQTRVDGKKTQQFTFDEKTKTIQSVNFKNKALEIQNEGRNGNVEIQAVTSRWFQLFRLKGEFIINEKGKAIDVAGGIDKENSNVQVWVLNKTPAQQWDIVYLDEFKPDPKKGDMALEFGLYIGRPFHIVSELPSRRYLDIVGKKPVIKIDNGRDSQKWMFNWATRSIQSMSSGGLSLTMNARQNNQLTLAKSQSLWFNIFKYTDGCIENTSRDFVLDVKSGKDAEGMVVINQRRSGGKNQKWKILYVDQAIALPLKGMNKSFGFYIDRPFYIVNKMPAKRALEVVGKGHNVVIMKRSTRKSQLWTFDNKSKTIQSVAFKNFALQIAGEGRSRNVNAYLTNSRWFQLWKMKGEFIENEKKMVLDVSGGRDVNNRNVQVWPLNKSAAQRWEILYQDEVKPEPKKGELNTEYGLYVEREFYAVSAMTSRRYLSWSTKGNNVVIQNANGSKKQKWIFDHETKTIKSVYNKAYSLDNQNAGRSINLRVWKTNSGWWQTFKYQDSHFIGGRGKALDVNRGRDVEDQNVMLWKKHNGANQRWNIIYCDEAAKHTQFVPKGKVNKYGYYNSYVFYIKNELKGGRVLDAPAGNNVVINTLNRSATQKWFYDPFTNTIRNLAFKDKSLSIENGGSRVIKRKTDHRSLVIEKTSGDWSQQFTYRAQDHHILNKAGAFDVWFGRDRNGQNVVVWWDVHNRGSGQKWSITYTGQIQKEDKKQLTGFDKAFGFWWGRPFKIVTAMASGRLVTTDGKNVYLGDRIRKGNDKVQIWHFDAKTKTILSDNYKNKSFDYAGKTGRGSNLQIQKTSTGWWQKFRFYGTYIQNQRGLVLDVAAAVDRNGQNICVWTKTDAKKQKWRIEYINRKPVKPIKKADPKKGELSAEHGLYVERPFYIVSHLEGGRYLENSKNGNKIIIKKESGLEEQQWWFDFKNRVIRSKANSGYCLGAENNGKKRVLVGKKWIFIANYKLSMLPIAKKQACKHSQVKFHKDGFITYRVNGQVMSIQDGKDFDGGHVQLQKKTGAKYQKWSVVYVDGAKIKQPKGKWAFDAKYQFYIQRPFRIITQMKSKRVISVVGGQNVVIQNRSAKNTQVWFYDGLSKTVRSQAFKRQNLSIGGGAKSRRGGTLELAKTSAGWWQRFKVFGTYIQNERGLVVDVEGGKDQNNQNVLLWSKHKGTNQKWTIEYLDQVKSKGPGVGQWSKQYGMYVERPFFIINKLKGGRYLDIKNNKPVIMKQNKSVTQQWWFDIASKTIRSMSGKKLALNISVIGGKGRNANLRTTNLDLQEATGQWWQQFMIRGQFMTNIRNKYNLDVYGGKDFDGNKVHAWKHNGTGAQRWSFVYTDSITKKQTETATSSYRTNYILNKEYSFYANRPFSIVTKMRSGRAITLVGNKILLKTKNNQASQMWNFNAKSQTIEPLTKKGMSLAMVGNGNNNRRPTGLTIQSTNDKAWWQKFKFQKSRILSVKGKAVDSSQIDREGSPIHMWSQHNGMNQKWKLQYTGHINKVKTRNSVGGAYKFNKKHGFFMDRPFRVVSALGSRRCLSIRNGRTVITNRDNGNKSQVWVFDGKTMTLRQNFAKNKHLTSPYKYKGPVCLKGRSLMSRAFSPKQTYTQSFTIKGEFILNPAGMALDVHGGRDNQNQGVVQWPKHNGKNQKWRIEYFGGRGIKMIRKTKKVSYSMNKYFGLYINRPFNIVSKLKSGRMLTVQGKNVVIANKNNQVNQIWVFDPNTRNINTQAQKGMSLAMEKNGNRNNRGTNIVLERSNGRVWWQKFRFMDQHLASVKGLALDVWRGQDAQNQNVVVWSKHGGNNQKWEIKYLKQSDTGIQIKQTEKFTYDKFYGLYVNRPFRVITKLSSGRVLTSIKNNIVIASKDAAASQYWLFDPATKTIQSQTQQGMSLALDKNGNNNQRGTNLVLQKSQNSVKWQKFKFQGQQIRAASGLALDIWRGRDAQNQNVVVWSTHGGNNQKWIIEYAKTTKKITKTSRGYGRSMYNKSYGLYTNRPFHIVTRMNSGRMITVDGNRILLKTPNNQAGQVWMLGGKSLRFQSQSKVGYSLAMVNNGNNNRRPTGLGLQATDAKAWWQSFRIQGTWIFNQKGKAVDSSHGDKEGSAIHMWDKHNGVNQKWKIVYLRKSGKSVQTTQGSYKFDKRFGMYVNRPFNIVTKMRSGRMITVAGNRILLKTKNNQAGQVWMLGSSLNLESLSQKGMSLSMVRNGNNNRRPTGLTLQKTNSKNWWQSFRIQGTWIFNARGKAVDSSHGDKEGSAIHMWDKHNGVNQRWSIQYLAAGKSTKITGRKSKGTFMKVYGLWTNRPFQIVTALKSGRLLTASGNNIVIANKNNKSSQLWQFNSKTLTIQSKANNQLSIAMDRNGNNNARGSNLVLQKSNNRAWWQKFRFYKEHIENSRTLAIDVSGGRDSHNQNVLLWSKHNGPNQRWSIKYVSNKQISGFTSKAGKKYIFDRAAGLYIGRDFRFVSNLPSRRVLSVKGGRNVVLDDRNNSNLQVFYYNPAEKRIQSKGFKDKCLDIENAGNRGREGNMQIWSCNGGWFQKFKYESEHILVVNKDKKSIQVQGNSDKKDQNIIIADYNTNKGTTWKIQYADESVASVTTAKKTTVLGDYKYNTNAGLFVMRPFRIVSRLESKRLMGVKGLNVVAMDRSLDKSQVFYFTEKNSCIRTQASPGKCLDIEGGSQAPGANLMVWAAHPTAWNQQFKYFQNGYIQNKRGMVAYVGRDANYGNVQMARLNKRDARQQWMIEYVDKSAHKGTTTSLKFNRAANMWEGRPFRLVSQMPNQRLLSVKLGSNITLKDRSADDSQVFFYDPKTQCIRSQAFKEKCLDISGARQAPGANLLLWKSHGGWNQKFSFTEDGFIMNTKGNVAQIYAKDDKNEQNIVMAAKVAGAKDLLWKIEYVDQNPFNKEFGLVENRSFSLISALNPGLALFRRGNDLVLANDKAFNNKLFIFDGKTQCIKPESGMDLCIDGTTSERPGSKLRLSRGNGSWGQKFRYDGSSLANERYLVIDVDKVADRTDDSHAVTIQGKSRKPNQQWIVFYQ